MPDWEKALDDATIQNNFVFEERKQSRRELTAKEFGLMFTSKTLTVTVGLM